MFPKKKKGCFRICTEDYFTSVPSYPIEGYLHNVYGKPQAQRLLTVVKQ